MANTSVTFLTDAARASSGSSDSQATLSYRSGFFELRISNVSGTLPTLDVVIQTSQDNTNWKDLYAFDRQEVVATVLYGVPNDTEWGFGNYLRINYTIGGSATPTFTFSVIASMKEV